MLTLLISIMTAQGWEVWGGDAICRVLSEKTFFLKLWSRNILRTTSVITYIISKVLVDLFLKVERHAWVFFFIQVFIYLSF